MNTWLAAPLLILTLIILGDGVALFVAGLKLWRLRRVSELALPFALVLFTLAFSNLNEVVNTAMNLRDVELSTAYLVQAYLGRGLRAAASWYLALKLTSEYSDTRQ